jgi:NAD(P)-dependent dehydrogenase (short-subunit alcohol dehydrogenase family)
MNDPFFSNKLALITGASRGLGRAMAVSLGAAGAQVILCARDKEQLQLTARMVDQAGGKALTRELNVTDEREVAQLDEWVKAEVGQVDILINNAGMNLRKQLTEFTLEEWRRVLDTNLTSVFLMCRAFVPHMKGRGYGRVINMTSIMSHVSLPQRTAYSASKAALIGLTKSLALELATEGITVNGISPGPFGTEMNQAIMQNEELNQQFISKIPVGRWGRVEEIGQLALYLCSDHAGFITGTDILIDGGWTAS